MERRRPQGNPRPVAPAKQGSPTDLTIARAIEYYAKQSLSAWMTAENVNALKKSKKGRNTGLELEAMSQMEDEQASKLAALRETLPKFASGNNS